MEINWNEILGTIVDVCVDVALKILFSVIVLIIGRIIIKAVSKRMRKSRALEKADPMAKKFFEAFVKIALNISLVVLIVAIMGVPMASIVAVIGSVGVAISLAVQGTLSNLSSGLMLLVFKPFKLDDHIETGDYSGLVTDMGVFYTTITTFDNRTVVIPNSSLTSSTLINYSTKDIRRLDLQFSVEYGSDVDKIKEILNEAFVRHGAEIVQDRAPFIKITELRETSLCITARVWSKKEDFWNLKFCITEEIISEFIKQGINVPYNRMVVINNQKDEEK